MCQWKLSIERLHSYLSDTVTDNTTEALLDEATRLIGDIDASTIADTDSRHLLNTVVDGLRELTRRRCVFSRVGLSFIQALTVLIRDKHKRLQQMASSRSSRLFQLHQSRLTT